MIDQPIRANTVLQLTAVIRLTVPQVEIRNVMGSAISEVFATIASQGLSPVGPLFSHHLRMVPDLFDLEVGQVSHVLQHHGVQCRGCDVRPRPLNVQPRLFGVVSEFGK